MSRITLSDRVAIEAGLYAKLSLRKIAEKIQKSPRYVSEELKRNSTKIQGVRPHGKDCWNATECKRVKLCGDSFCQKRCVACQTVDCRTVCRAYNNSPCVNLKRPPYVCNTCNLRRKCKLDRAYYIAQQADAMARRRYSDARSKPHLRGAEMDALDRLVSPLVKKGQPLTHICLTHADEIPVSQRTLYNYIGDRQLSIGNLDLRRKVGYRPRRKKKEPSEAFMNQEFRKTRSYLDFLEYMEKHPNTPYVEMDTVKGVREKGKRLLTLLFTEQNFMLMLLMPDGTADSVVERINWLTGALGLDTFRSLFPVILTDNGSEFKHTREMETTEDGERRTKVFYCDPQASWQKAHIEKNHEYIRYVLPKGKSLSPFEQDDMTLLMSHINSTKRDKLGGKSPFELFTRPDHQKLITVLGLQEIPADEINLTPRLLKRNTSRA